MKMKDSGIEWIGEIPEDWKTILCKYNFEIASGSTPESSKQDYWDGDIFWITPADYKTDDKYVAKGKRNISLAGYNSCSTNLIPKGSIIFSKRAPIGNVAIAKNDLCTNQGCLACTPLNENCSTDYYYYFFAVGTEHYNLLGSGTTFKEISATAFENSKILLPPLSTQNRIADFLDLKCAKIDALVSNEEKQIEKLKAYKQALITETVTKGLDKTAKMKDSGVEWIGEIPEGWEVVRLKAILKNISEKGYGDSTVLSLYRDYGVIPKDSRDDNHNVTSLDTNSYKHVRVNDLVINKMKAWQGSLSVSNYEGIVSPAYYVCEIKQDKLIPRFLHHFLRNKMLVQKYEQISAGMRIGQWDMGIDDFLGIYIFFPTIEKQKEICDFIDTRCSQIDRLISLKESKIEKLSAYKKSLIYEYVTGKKEIK